MTLRRAAAVVVLAAVGLACSDDSTRPIEQLGDDAASYWPGASWRTATPAQVGVDAAAIADLITRLRNGSLGAEHALLIVRKGYVIADEYFGGWTADSIHTEQSVTKSVRTVDQPMVDLLGQYAPIANLDDRKRALTVRDVLTMRTGMDWNYAGRRAA